MSDITAWYDEEKRAKILRDDLEIYYYMIHATHPQERMHWADEFMKANIKNPSRITNGTNTGSGRARLQD